MSRNGRNSVCQQSRPRKVAPVARERDPREFHPVWLLAIAILLAPLAGGNLGDRVLIAPGVSTVWELVAWPICLLVTALSSVLLLGRMKPSRLPFGWFLGLFCALGVMGCFVSVNRYHTLSFLAILFASLLAGRAALETCRVERARNWIIGSLLAAPALVAVNGIGEFIQSWRQGIHFWRIFGGFNNPDFLAGYLLLTILLALAIYLTSQDRRWTLLSGASLALQFTALALTQSRLGIVAMAGGLILFVLLGWKYGMKASLTSRRAKLLALVGAGLTLLAAPAVVRRFLGARTDSHSASYRLYAWDGARRMAMAHPALGTGLGTFETAFPRYAQVGYTQHAHNSYAQVAAEGGLLSVVVLLAGIAAPLALVFRGLRSISRAIETDEPSHGESITPSKTPSETTQIHQGRAIAAAVLSGAAAFLAHNLFDSDLFIPAISFTFTVVVAIAVSVVSDENQVSGESSVRLSVAYRSAYGLGIAFCVGWAAITAQGRLNYHTGLLNLQENEPYAAAEKLRSAVSIDRWNPEPGYALSGLLKQLGETREAEEILKVALSRADTGKGRFQLGKLLVSMGNLPDAIQQFQLARQRDPRNLSNLLALAEAQAESGDGGGSEETFRYIAALRGTPFDQVRPIPELVNWEIGLALMKLAELEQSRGKPEIERDRLREAHQVLAECWANRTHDMVRQRIGNANWNRIADQLEKCMERLLRLEAGPDRARVEQSKARFSEERAKFDPTHEGQGH